MKAKDNGVKYEILVQYDGLESNITDIYERVKKNYVDDGHDIETFKEIKLYIKPQDFTAYYVVNGDYTGKVGLF